MGFRPLIRGFFFYRGNCWKYRIKAVLVSVPSFGDSFFMKSSWTTVAAGILESFRPLIRGFFFYPLSMESLPFPHISFPSPHSGILFLCAAITTESLKKTMVSVPSFGDSFFIVVKMYEHTTTTDGFRPLIRGFFFYNSTAKGYQEGETHYGFRPLIRGFFFYNGNGGNPSIAREIVSVPSFGDSFFI